MEKTEAQIKPKAVKMFQGQPITEKMDVKVLQEHLENQHENMKINMKMIEAQIVAIA